MRTARALTVVLIFMVSLVTLSTRLESSAAAATSPSQDALHEVLPGDNLRLIAGYYYGDARQWERIWNANRDQVRNPNRIERGDFLRIPDATVPMESYTDFVARARRPVSLQAAPIVPPIPPIGVQAPAGPSPLPQPPAKPSPDRVALPAPTKAPAPGAGPTAPAPTPAPVAAPPQKAAAPAAPPAPQPTKAPAVAATPPGAQPPAPSATPAPAPAKQATVPPAPAAAKAPGPPATGPTKAAPAPPPPPKVWYEEWGLDELATSPLFLGGVAVVVLGLAAILLIRRRRSAASAVVEIPE